MRNNQPVSQREYAFPDQQRLISTTDLKGQITYCNDIFAEVSGFARDELIRAPHNLVRHPDVPPAVFEHMWTTLKQGKPWMGVVKNRRKNGDHYWVNAYVTPILDQQRQVTGYESVRTKPTREQIQRAEALYARLNAGKSGVPRSDVWLPVLMKWLPFILVGQIGFLLGAFFDHAVGFMAAALLSIPLGLAGLHWQQRGLRRLMQLAQQSTSDPLIARMYTDSRGVEAQLEMAMLSQQAHLKTCLTRLQDTAVQLQGQAKEADTLAQNCANGLVQQHQETEQVATAINEMAATTQEVASNVALAADATREASRLTVHGREVTAETRKAIQQLSDSVAKTGEAVNQLASDSEAIGSVVDVIKSIADQTNLLALNAAIEAARRRERPRLRRGCRRGTPAGPAYRGGHRRDPPADRKAAAAGTPRRADHRGRSGPCQPRRRAGAPGRPGADGHQRGHGQYHRHDHADRLGHRRAERRRRRDQPQRQHHRPPRRPDRRRRP